MISQRSRTFFRDQIFKKQNIHFLTLLATPDRPTDMATVCPGDGAHILLMCPSADGSGGEEFMPATLRANGDVFKLPRASNGAGALCLGFDLTLLRDKYAAPIEVIFAPTVPFTMGVVEYGWWGCPRVTDAMVWAWPPETNHAFVPATETTAGEFFAAVAVVVKVA